ncbi:DUF7700 domain-containing protein [Mycolicibacterium stellerae]|uniref:DUF7700 domain-containing protein n=1 Tax=Mycolicibacterium stellerae TaxID=2358193 RepID=UPI000F0B14FC|nr:hypothetical protein [Mycolicibacterium stellerae]
MVGNDVIIPKGLIEDLVKPVPANTRYVKCGPVTFGVEFRELNARVIKENYGHDVEAMKFFEPMMNIDDIGVTLHVYSTDDSLEHLRFDAFGDKPHLHYHYILPDGSHRKLDYDFAACGDMIPWAMRTMVERLPEMLREAKATEVADRVDVDEVQKIAPTIIEMASRMLADRSAARLDEPRAEPEMT